jgi:hypothetical protein
MIFGFMSGFFTLVLLIFLIWADWSSRLSEKLRKVITERAVERCR